MHTCIYIGTYLYPGTCIQEPVHIYMYSYIGKYSSRENYLCTYIHIHILLQLLNIQLCTIAFMHVYGNVFVYLYLKMFSYMCVNMFVWLMDACCRACISQCYELQHLYSYLVSGLHYTFA